MKKATAILTLITAGIVIVVLPDNDQRLFSLSRDHGPSIQDAIGLILIFIGYAWFLVNTWKQREKLFRYKNRLLFRLVPIFLLIGIILIVVSVINDYGYWWLCGAIILAIVQSFIFYVALAD